MTFLTDQKVKLAVQIGPQGFEYSQIRSLVLKLEDLGADAIFNWDHFYPLHGDPEGKHFECWSMLAAIAEQTERVELGPLVNCNSYRNPNLQADIARTVDHISAKNGQGRLIFGIGSGWAEKDYVEYGYEFGTRGSRLNDLARDLPIIRDRWTKLNPLPTRKIPILIGGKGEQKTLRMVAEHADIWHSFVQPEELDHKFEVLRGHAEAVGADLSQLTISNELKTRDEATADALYDKGVRLFTLGLLGPDPDLDLVRNWLSWRDSKN